ncbi:MAG: IS1182 family transposase [Ktedonobacterales bacterium]
MSLPRDPLQPIPAETARVAHAAFPAGNLYMRVRDELGPLFDDERFTTVYAHEGQPALHPWQLALVSVMQFAENLSDRQAAEAVRARIDWKYALGLDQTDDGFHYSVLSEFRTRLVQGGIERILLDTLLEQCRKRGWLKARGRQRTDSTHVLGAVKALNQLELVGETLRHALNVLATVAPDWLKAHALPEWFVRYAERIEDYRLPKDKTEREALSVEIGDDGYHLLDGIEHAATPHTPDDSDGWAWLKELPAVRTLEQVWAQQYHRRDNGHAQRLSPQERPPVGEWLRSPYDSDVRYGRKRGIEWIGYKVHLTEGCDDGRPHLITDVHTTPAIEQDHHALDTIQEHLATSALLPTEHLVDAGYISAKRILHSRDAHAIDLIGPVHIDPSWQARTPGALDLAQFTIDWKAQRVTCPQGQHSVWWHPAKDAKGESVVQVVFAKPVCDACLIRSRCTDAQATGRSMTFRFPQERHEMLLAARQRQQAEAFKALYRLRAGIEGTFSQTTRNTGVRHARYRGLPKTHLQHIFTAVATHLLRLHEWLNGTPFAQTRTSRFAALAA